MSSKNVLWLLPLAVLASCSGSGERSYDSKSAPAAAQIVSTDSTASADKNLAINSPERKVIRTADLRCKVTNVFTATTQLEQLVRAVGGVVQESHMDNNGSETKSSYYSEDSLKQSQTYTTTSTLTLRVPTLLLDSVISTIPGMVSFIDSRSIKQNDVTYQYLNNELKNKVGDNTNTITRSMQLTRKSKEPIEVQQYADSRQEQKIDRKIENLQLMDNVSYATLTVSFSQPEQVFTQIVVNANNLNRTPFLTRCKEAWISGWSSITSFVVLLVNIWPLLLLLGVAFISYRKLSGRQLRLARK